MHSFRLSLFNSFLLTIIFLLFGFRASAQWSLDLESGLIFPGYNEVRIPNAQGSLFSFADDFEQEGFLFPIRLRAEYRFKEKNHIYLLLAPLTANFQNASLGESIQFQNSSFEEGLASQGLYRFNSYRLTYRRDLINSGGFQIALGFTAKIRDARVQLSNQTGLMDRKDDLGFVPLLHIYLGYHGEGYRLFLEGDGLAGGPGRAFDFFIGAQKSLYKGLHLRGGYRILEGGADVEEVYNFALFQFASLAIRYEW